MSRELIYLGKGNTIDWQLQADGVAVDLASVTRMVAEVAGVTIDSADTGGNSQGNPFYWTSGVPSAGVANLFLTLGEKLAADSTAAGTYRLRLTIYDPDHSNGLVWVSTERVKIVA